MHKFIPSRLQLFYPSSRPWYTETCGKAVVLKQLAFASWKANLTEGNLSSFHKARNKCVSTLRRDRKHHLSNLKSELSNLSPSSKSWWHLVKSVSGVCSPSIPSLRPRSHLPRRPWGLQNRWPLAIIRRPQYFHSHTM